MTPTASALDFRNPASFAPATLTFPDPAEVCAIRPALQKAVFRPTKAITLTVPAISSASLATAPYPISSRDVRQRKTLRTVLYDANGRLQGAKIDLSTGEVIPHQYKDYFNQGPRARINPNAPDLEPFWMSMPAATRSTGTPKEHDKSRCKRFNAVKMYLEDYTSLDEASDDLPILRDIIASVALLDLGRNTRPLNQSLLFWMLQHIDIITPETVMDFMSCGLRHAQKVAGCLRVIVNAFEMASEGKLSTHTRVTPPKKRAVRKRGQHKP